MKRRPTTRGTALLERLEAVLRNPVVYEIASQIPNPDPSRGGRPRLYPAYTWLLFESLISVFQSARQVEAELAHPLVWRFLRELAVELFPEDTSMHLPAEPMTRHHYRYGRDRYLTDPSVLEQLKDVARAGAARQANEIGLMDQQGEGSWSHPSLDRMLYADGKVITPLFRPGKLGERPKRFEPDAALHAEGTGEFAFGVKYVVVAARTPDVHGRIILDVEWVPKAGAEASTAMGCFRRLRQNLPGAQGLIYDGALRGVHHQEILRDLGWIPVSKVTAASVSRSKKPGRRREKTSFIEMKKVTTPAGEQTVSLYARAGAVAAGQLDDRGELHLTNLKRLKTHRAQDKRGRFRWYNEYALPDSFGGKSVVVRLDTTDADRARGFNRTENVRPIAPSDPDFPALIRRRIDIESINRGVDDSLYLGRAHSVGHARQTVNLLGFMLMVNGLAIHRHRQRLQSAA